MALPRVLIFGQPFNYRHGGGITLSNLFHGWDKKSLAVAASGHVMNNVTTDVCDTYYQLGSDEYKWRFPFNYFQRTFTSGLLRFEENPNDSMTERDQGLRYYIVNNIFYPTLEWLGIFHGAARYSFSDDFLAWVKEYSPQILYFQVSSYDTIKFARRLQEFLGIPSVLHMMDDWPSTISQKGPFRKMWHRRIDGELRSLMDNASLLLSISEAMSDEYSVRYGKTFISFHNPIDLERFSTNDKPVMSDNKCFRILYLGRVGTANRQSLLKFASFISNYNNSDKNVEFDIYTNDNKELGYKKIMKYRGVSVFEAVSYDQVPFLMRCYDLLLLPLDFTNLGLKFSRYSMPTKASEYMASGIPILVFAPRETAISMFCLKYQCGYCVNSQEMNDLEKAINLLINDFDYRSIIVDRAKRLAFQLFDGERVRGNFQSLISQLLVSGNDELINVQ